MKNYDIAIIGGGASGLAAAVFAARAGASVIILEKSARVGRKLLATGNGTCNISNAGELFPAYHGKSPDFAVPALTAFNSGKVADFFASIGVECVTREDGRMYPLCAQAGAVLDCLRMECAALGVVEQCDAKVEAIQSHRDMLTLSAGGKSIGTRRAILCTGGAAAPKLGGDAEAYLLPLALGHTCTALAPSIVQLTTDTGYIRSLKGVRVDGCISIELNGEVVACSTDEILFADYGLSGPAAMQVSRHVAANREKSANMTAVLDLIPVLSEREVAYSIEMRIAMKGRTIGDLLTGLLQKRLGQTVLRSLGYALSSDVGSLATKDVRVIASAIKRWSVRVTGTRGLSDAQVTAGGLNTSEFDAVTMRSRLESKLYVAGEVLDIDGDCGGFNLQWAWSSAYIAAQSAVASL